MYYEGEELTGKHGDEIEQLTGIHVPPYQKETTSSEFVEAVPRDRAASKTERTDP